MKSINMEERFKNIIATHYPDVDSWIAQKILNFFKLNTFLFGVCICGAILWGVLGIFYRKNFDTCIVMACGAFTQGSTIELSGDAPVIEPYTFYMQGGLTYEYGKLSIMLALTKILKNKEA